MKTDQERNASEQEGWRKLIVATQEWYTALPTDKKEYGELPTDDEWGELFHAWLCAPGGCEAFDRIVAEHPELMTEDYWRMLEEEAAQERNA